MAEQFRQVGELVNLNTRKMIRNRKNPMDKCTIVSIFQKDICEVKHTIEPGVFHIPAGTPDKPAILTVGASSWWREIDLDQPMLEIPVSSIQVAESIIRDYCNGLLGCNMADIMPGMFFVLGQVSLAEIRTNYRDKLAEAKANQDRWFEVLVKAADSLWARANGNPLVIMDEMRLAAKTLNYNDKPWLRDFVISQMAKCAACGSLRNPEFPVCATCKFIDPNHPASKELKFAI